MKKLKILVLILLTTNLIFAKSSHHMQNVNDLTLKERVELVFLVGTNSSNIYNHKNNWLKSRNLAGVFLLGKEFSKSKSVKTYIKALNEKKDLPFLIAIDQEGGRVQRIKDDQFKLSSASTYGEINSGLLCYQNAQNLGEKLKSLGVHIYLGPVLDIDRNDKNHIIGNRSFSPNKTIVAKCSIAFALGLKNVNITSCAKHFPNHGDTRYDSHKKLPIINKPINEVFKNIIPYNYYIKHKLPMIMISHIKYPKIDERYPASLSKKIITDYLKNILNFEGIIITDDLNMQAITKNYSLPYACFLALQAGSDILLIDQSPEVIDSCINYILEKIKQNELSEDDLNSKVNKILNLKKYHKNSIT